MRFVELSRRGGGSAEVFDLHDQLTVIRGLDGASRAWLLDALGRFGSASVDAATGEIEVAGIILPLDAGSLELLGLDGRRDSVIDARRLLGEASAWSESEDIVPSDRSNPDAGGGDGFGGTLGDGGPMSLDTFGELVVGSVEGSAEEEEAADPVDSWFRDPTSGGAEPRVDQADGRAGDGDDNPLLLRIMALEARRAELEGLAESIDSSDLEAVRAALDDLENAPVDKPLPEAAELADAWSDLQKDLKGIALGTSEEERQALEAVAVARQAVEDAEAVLAKPQLTDEQMARIEAAHAAYLEASEKVDRRFGGNKARRQLADAEAEETRLLSRFGFDSWVDYVISASRRTEDPELTSEHEVLEAAQAELEICIAELDAIPGAVGRRHRRVRLRDQERDLSDRVAELLGHEPVGDEVVPELLALRSRYEPQAEVSALTSVMAAGGIDLDGASDEPDLLVARARQALAVQDHADRRRSDLQMAVDALRGAVAVLREAADAGATTVPEMPPLPDMAEPPVSFVDAVTDAVPSDAEPAGADGLPASPEPVPDVEPVVGEAIDGDTESGTEAEMKTEAEEGGGVESSADAGGSGMFSDEAEPVVEVQVHPDRTAHPDRAALLDDVQWEAMSAMAALRLDGPAGQLPVVFDEAFAMLDDDECLGLLSRLVRFTDQVQMILLTDRPEVAEWARAIGEDHARVIEVVS